MLSPLVLGPGGDFNVDVMQVTFPANSMVGDDECFTVTGIPDMEPEGRERLGVTIDGSGNDFSEFVTIFVEDDDAG